MVNNWQDIKSQIVYSPNGILSKELVKSQNYNITLFTMAADTTISEHTTTKDGLIYVLEGDGEFNLAKEKIKMVPGVFIQMSRNSVHSLWARQNTAFILILINNSSPASS